MGQAKSLEEIELKRLFADCLNRSQWPKKSFGHFAWALGWYACGGNCSVASQRCH